jgi:hypothetical protein
VRRGEYTTKGNKESTLKKKTRWQKRFMNSKSNNVHKTHTKLINFTNFIQIA